MAAHLGLAVPLCPTPPGLVACQCFPPWPWVFPALLPPCVYRYRQPLSLQAMKRLRNAVKGVPFVHCIVREADQKEPSKDMHFLGSQAGKTQAREQKGKEMSQATPMLKRSRRLRKRKFCSRQLSPPDCAAAVCDCALRHFISSASKTPVSQLFSR